MNPEQNPPLQPVPTPPSIRTRAASSPPRHPLIATPTSGAQRKIAIAVDLSEESAYAIQWAVQNYLRPGDTVVLLHVRPTSVLYGADWGAVHVGGGGVVDGEEEEGSERPSKEDELSESDFDDLAAAKANGLAKPLVEAGVPYKVHIVKDHDMKERLCLEVERLGLSAMIMGSRGFGASSSRKGSKGRLGSVSDYCVHHCICPVVVVRFSDAEGGGGKKVAAAAEEDEELELHPVPEEEDLEDCDGSD